MPFSIIGQQGRSLLVLVDDMAAWKGITTQKTRHTDGKAEHEQEAADGKRKYPLQLQEMWAGQELAYAGC